MNKIKITLAYFITLLTVLLVPLLPAQAQDTGNSLLFGQIQRYSVIFRGDGQAVVYARIVVTNPNNEPLSQISVQGSGAQFYNFTAFQQVLPQTCVQPSYAYNTGNNCLKYSDPNYNQDYYYGYNYLGNGDQPKYYPLTVNQNGNNYQMTLSQPIDSTKSGALIISYLASGYVKKNSFGLYSFDFQTLKTSDRVTDLRVSVDVDGDLYLKGKNSQVNYNTPTSMNAETGLASASTANPLFNSVAEQIGQYGALVKTARDLAPKETFSVKGEYADSWWQLYLNNILLSLLIIAGIIVGAYWLAKFIKRRQEAALSSNPKPESQTTNSLPTYSPTSYFFLSLGLGFVVDVVILLLNFLLSALGSLYDSYTIYQNGSLSAIIMIVVVLLYGSVLIFPAIWMGSKRGWKAAMAVIVFEIVWLIILGLLYVVLFQTFNHLPVYPGNYLYNM